MQVQTKPIADILYEEKRPPPKVRAKIYGGRYLVTDEGEIYTMGIKGGPNVHLQITRLNNRGYLRANIGRHDEYVHRIVATCFVPNPHGYLEVNHIDGNKTNNHASNLEWCTRSENNRHAFRTGLRSYEELRIIARMPKIKSRRLTPEQVKIVREKLKGGCSAGSLSREFHCNRTTIENIKYNKCYREEMYYA